MAFFKDFLMKQMLKRQMKGVPEAEQDRIIALVGENPEFFENIAKEVEAKTKQGKPQMAAVMETMRMHQAELQKLMGGQKK
jgi:transcription elongation factor GreA-like protein